MIKLLIALYLLVVSFEEDNKQAAEAANPVEIKSIEVVEKIEVELRPHIPDIPLSNDVLDYMYEVSKEYDIAYSLVLAMADVESTFRTDVISVAGCIGLMQLSPNTAEWIASELAIEQYDLQDARTSILFGVYYLDYLRDQWLGRGYSEEDAYVMTIISYNRGEAGAKKWVSEQGFNNKYYEKVNEKKEFYEGLIYEQNHD